MSNEAFRFDLEHPSLNYELAHEVSERLMMAGIAFGVFSGAHASLLGEHRQTQDIDIWADEQQLDLLRETFPEVTIELRTIEQQLSDNPKRYMAHNGFMMYFGGSEEVSIMGGTADYIDGQIYPTGFQSAAPRLQYQTLHGLSTYFVDPADTVLVKALMQRDLDQGKNDIEDIKAIARKVDIDIPHLLKQVRLRHAEARVIPLLLKIGVLNQADLQTRQQYE